MRQRRPPAEKPPSRPLPLPTRDGVGPSCVSLPEGPWPTISAFLAERFTAIPPASWEARLRAGDVVDEHGVAVTQARRFEPRLRVYYYRTLDTERRIPFEESVIYQDERLVIADKPHFLPVSPVGKYVQETLLVRLKRKLGLDHLVPVHRIDRETAGLVMFSAEPASRGVYHALFSQRVMVKHYEAVVPWTEGQALPPVHRSRLMDDEEHFMLMKETEGEPNSETRLELLEARGGLARLRLSPVSGRRHQLRVHCAALGMPILNDAIYPRLLPEGADDFERPLQLLAKSLAFRDPLSGEERRFESARTLMRLPA